MFQTSKLGKKQMKNVKNMYHDSILDLTKIEINPTTKMKEIIIISISVALHKSSNVISYTQL